MDCFDVIERIKDLCAARSFSFYRLAKESGIPYSTLSNILNRGNLPSIPTLAKLCHGLGIELDDFFRTEIPAPRIAPEQEPLFRAWSALTPENRAAAEEYIHFLLSRQDKQK